MGTQGTTLGASASRHHAVRTAARTVAWEQASAVAFRAGAAILLGCVALFVWRSREWPLVNDAALMHYVVFLTSKGLAPYRQIGDYNLPGSYAPEWLAMMLAGLLHVSGSVMWRIFDFSCLLLSGAAMVTIARRTGWFAGTWAASLFTLLHARDGIGQAGQRDLWMAMLLLWGVALLCRAMRHAGGRAVLLSIAAFGICVAAAATIKPQAALWYICLAALLPHEPGLRRRVRILFACAGGAAVPVLAIVAYLGHAHAFGAFRHTFLVELPYHVSLARVPLSQLLRSSFIPSLVKLTLFGAAAWLALLLDRREPLPDRFFRSELRLLALCTMLGFASFSLQGKGYTYQRYPFLAFLLLTLGVVLVRAVQARGWPPRLLGMTGLAFGVLFCAPGYLHAGDRAHWPTDALGAMEAAITSAAGPAGVASLDGRIQCIDTVSGCTDALLALRLRPATRLFYDELLFPESLSGVPGPGTPIAPAVAEARAEFADAVRRQPPRVILLSSWLFPEGPGDYRELQSWPWLAQELASRYVLFTEREYPRAENGPLGFRVYVLRPMNSAAQQGA